MAIFLTQYLQLVRAMIPLTAALWSVLPSVAVGGVAPLASALGRRFGRALMIAGGFAVMAAGFALLTVVGAHSQLSVVLVAASLYASGGVGLMSQVSEVVMAAAPTERAGTASALLESGTELGGALGMAVLGSVGTALARGSAGSCRPTCPPRPAARCATRPAAPRACLPSCRRPCAVRCWRRPGTPSAAGCRARPSQRRC
ncbi:MFS transporter [Kitasatospora aureofaciens]|uniref:hypothetical protein n=1 Tax=Kitasatospora aureofaciens TaxID=1894 RepID=UPI0036F482C7